MSWQKQHPVESIVEWIAPIPLASSLAWACLRLGFTTIEAAAAGLAALSAGFATLRIVGRSRSATSFAFEPGEVDPADLDADELLLDEVVEVLELDDPLTAIAPESRVVQLFARQEPTPGELVERIADYLGEGRPEAAIAINDAKPVDASAALQAALANIRASLR